MSKARRTNVNGRLVLTGPPPSGSIRKAKVQPIPAGTLVRRIFWPDPWKATPTGFRRNGPRARFDHHLRPGPFPATWDDPNRGVFYAAESFECCVLECFGDDWGVETRGARLAVLEVRQELLLLDVRGRGANAAGTLAAINQDGDREVTQDWARWWYEAPEISDVHGLLFSGAHNAEDAIAVSERAAGRFTPVLDEPLDDPAVYAELLVAANQLDLPVLT